MTSFSDMPGIGPRLIDLLSAAGFEEPSDIRELSAQEMRQHLQEANKHHNLVRVLPTEGQIDSWLRQIKGTDESDGATGANYEQDADVIGMLVHAPVALVVPTAALAEQGIAPGSIAEPIYLNDVREHVEIRLPRRSSKGRKASPITRVQAWDVAEEQPKETPVALATDRIRSVEDFQTDEDKARIAAEKNSPENKERDERVKLMTTTRSGTNKGRTPGTRRFIRGVLHPLPMRMYTGAVVSILAFMMIPVAIIAGFTLFINKAMEPSPLPDLPEWIIIFPLLLPLLGLLYLIIAPGCRCRVCGQKMFIPKNCLKHRNAHKLPLIGYIIPTALHILSFKWFRCIFCGTPIRLKE